MPTSTQQEPCRSNKAAHSSELDFPRCLTESVEARGRVLQQYCWVVVLDNTAGFKNEDAIEVDDRSKSIWECRYLVELSKATFRKINARAIINRVASANSSRIERLMSWSVSAARSQLLQARWLNLVRYHSRRLLWLHPGAGCGFS